MATDGPEIPEELLPDQDRYHQETYGEPGDMGFVTDYKSTDLCFYETNDGGVVPAHVLWVKLWHPNSQSETTQTLAIDHDIVKELATIFTRVAALDPEEAMKTGRRYER